MSLLACARLISIEEDMNSATITYKAEPTIENYVRLRRTFPKMKIEVGVIGGLDQLIFMSDELRRHGLDPELLSARLDICWHRLAKFLLANFSALQPATIWQVTWGRASQRASFSR